MKSEEMKMKKFEMLIRDIDEYLGVTSICGEKRVSKISEEGEKIEEKVPISPIEFFLDNGGKNEYINLIYKNSFHIRTSSVYPCINLENIEKNDVTKVVELLRKCNTSCNEYTSCNVPNHLLFWLIFIVSVDNENYNENLSIVSDTAYLLGFDEAKLADWITAVKGVLKGKKLNEMKYQTKVAQSFFVR